MLNMLLSSYIVLPVASHVQTYSIQNRTSVVQNRKMDGCKEVRMCQTGVLTSGLLVSEFNFLYYRVSQSQDLISLLSAV